LTGHIDSDGEFIANGKGNWKTDFDFAREGDIEAVKLIKISQNINGKSRPRTTPSKISRSRSPGLRRNSRNQVIKRKTENAKSPLPVQWGCGNRTKTLKFCRHSPTKFSGGVGISVLGFSLTWGKSPGSEIKQSVLGTRHGAHGGPVAASQGRSALSRQRCL
jgi:hypothetical protein